MIKETGRVVAIEPDGLWVETIQLSSCASCSAQAGCGQGLLAKLGHKNVGHVRALLHEFDASQFHINDYVEIGIEENVITIDSLFAYLTPLFGLLVGAILGTRFADALPLSEEAASVVFGVLGLVVGGLGVKLKAYFYRNDKRYQPVVVSGPVNSGSVNSGPTNSSSGDSSRPAAADKIASDIAANNVPRAVI